MIPKNGCECYSPLHAAKTRIAELEADNAKLRAAMLNLDPERIWAKLWRVANPPQPAPAVPADVPLDVVARYDERMREERHEALLRKLQPAPELTLEQPMYRDCPAFPDCTLLTGSKECVCRAMDSRNEYLRGFEDGRAQPAPADAQAVVDAARYCYSRLRVLGIVAVPDCIARLEAALRDYDGEAQR